MAGTRESKISTHRSLNRRIIWRATYVGLFCWLFLTEGHVWENWDFDMPSKHQLRLYLLFLMNNFSSSFLDIWHYHMKITVSSILFSLKPTALGRFFVVFWGSTCWLNVQDLRGIQRSLAWCPRKRVAGPRSTTRGPSDNRDSVRNFGVTSLNRKVTGSS